MSSNWLEIAVEADEEAVEMVSEVLRAHGHGVAIDQPFVQPRIDDAPLPDRGRHPLVKTYLPDDPQAQVTCRQIEEALWHVGQLRHVGPVQVRTIAEEDWANSWKPFFPVLHLGARTVIVPAWRRYRAGPGEIIVRLDPGMAFGTGMHPTTRLCLEAVERRLQPGMRVLDVGTGSGILAIAAARLGASVVAVDTDPIAITSARGNLRRNALTRAVDVQEGSIDRVLERANGGAPLPPAEAFDLILSNITARANAAIAPSLRRALRPRGHIVASGILVDAVGIVEQAFAAVNLRIIDQAQDGDWLAVVATHG